MLLFCKNLTPTKSKNRDISPLEIVVQDGGFIGAENFMIVGKRGK
jgi:hypothetical protein